MNIKCFYGTLTPITLQRCFITITAGHVRSTCIHEAGPKTKELDLKYIYPTSWTKSVQFQCQSIWQFRYSEYLFVLILAGIITTISSLPWHLQKHSKVWTTQSSKRQINTLPGLLHLTKPVATVKENWSQDNADHPYFTPGPSMLKRRLVKVHQRLEVMQ